jgi:hypothetical protein
MTPAATFCALLKTQLVLLAETIEIGGHATCARQWQLV